MSTYAVIVERAEDGGFGAWCPDLPGCIALGETVDEAITQMREAITEQLADMRADGIEIPDSNTVSATTVDAS